VIGAPPYTAIFDPLGAFNASTVAHSIVARAFIFETRRLCVVDVTFRLNRKTSVSHRVING